MMINTRKICYGCFMTFSLLSFDQNTGTLAAVAATGSLCVGGWVLRGDLESGLVASQGTAPSTLWRDGILRDMRGGLSAQQALTRWTRPDSGAAHRQAAALDLQGTCAAHTGQASIPFADHILSPGLVVAGNMLSGPEVLPALIAGFDTGGDDPAPRLLNALEAAQRAGSDSRGLQSAALLVLRPDRPPLDLRVDYAEDPISMLRSLHARATASPYADWLHVCPVMAAPHRAPDVTDAAE